MKNIKTKLLKFVLTLLAIVGTAIQANATNFSLGRIGGTIQRSGTLTSSDYVSGVYGLFPSYAKIYSFTAAASGTAQITSWWASSTTGNYAVTITMEATGTGSTDIYNVGTRSMHVTAGATYRVKVYATLLNSQSFSFTLSLPGSSGSGGGGGSSGGGSTATYLTIDGETYNWTWTLNNGNATTDSFSVGCNGFWAASSSVSWITLGRASGTGSYSVSVSFAANPYSYSRTGTVTVRAGSLTRTISVTQPGGGPAPATYLTIDGETYNWTWTRASYVSSTDSFAIGCDGAWTASSSVSWIRLGATSGSGNRTVSVSIDANPYTYSRTGVITVKAGSFTRTISVTQPGKPSTYTVYFDANGGTIPGYGSSRSVTVTYGTRNYYSVPGATRGGYTFTGWYTSGGTQVYDAKGQAVAGGTYWDYNQRWNYYGGVTLYARWAAPSTYTVYFNANGGTIPGYGSSRSVTVTYGSRNYYSVPGATRGGYRFLGWYTSTSGGPQVYDARGQAVAYSTYWDGNQRWRYYGGVTLYARWEQTASSYTVYFNANGGTIPGYGTSRSVTVTYGSRNYYSVPGAQRGGYRFLGWYTSASGGTQVYDARGQAVAYSTYWDGNQRWRYYGGVTLYARWEQTGSSYTVYFNANGGSIPGYGTSRSVTVTYGTRNYYSVPGAARGGYRFLGWYTSDSYWAEQVYDARGQAVAYSTYWDGGQRWNYYGGVTLYARWELYDFKVGK